jgi:hypothetical protein
MSGDRDLRLPPHLQSGKLAFGELTDAFGGQVAAATETGKSQSRICAYAHSNTADFPPLDVIDALEARTVGVPGHPHVTLWLARRRGYELVKLPDPSAPPMSWASLLSEIIKASGELAGGILGDLSATNEISPSEAWLRLKDAGELVRVAVELEASLKARAAEGRGG